MPNETFMIVKETTMQEAIDRLQLPTRLSQTKLPLTSFSAINPAHMIQYINLSGFHFNGFSKQLLRQLINRIPEMRCLKAMALKQNGIGQQCAQEIEALLSIKRIIRIDLSSNALGKNCLQLITRNFAHLEWIDLCRNPFAFEKHVIPSLLNAIRLNPRIYHIQVDMQDEKLAAQLTSMLKTKPHIHSFAPVDTSLTQEAMENICIALEPMKDSKRQGPRLCALNLSFCYLNEPVISSLLKSLGINSSLVQLNLSSNCLTERNACNLCQILQKNVSLCDVNVSNNELGDEFAGRLANCLRKNETLQVMDVSRNNIGPEGAALLLSCLGEANDTLQSLGDLHSNGRIGAQITQKIHKSLRINRVSKEIRSQLINDSEQLPAVEIASRQKEAFLDAECQDYDLIQPIAISNPIRDDPFRLHLWNFQ